jgi:hypothetical protein
LVLFIVVPFDSMLQAGEPAGIGQSPRVCALILLISMRMERRVQQRQVRMGV